MRKASRSIFYAVLVLAAAEGILRAVERSAEPGTVKVVPSQETLFLNLGTSRTRRGVSPALCDSLLAARGVVRPWTANVTDYGATAVGLFRLYMRDVHRWAAAVDFRGFLAVEVRASGMNDRFLTKREERFLAGSGVLADSGAGAFSRAARAVFYRAAVFRAGEVIEEMKEKRRRGEKRRKASGTPATPALIDYLRTRTAWGADRARGWKPRDKEFDRNMARPIRKKFDDYLRDFTAGGIQAEALARLIRTARSDGFTVTLFIPPITDLLRDHYREGDYDVFLDLVGEIARGEKVRLVDFDTGHTFSDDLFNDSDHLNRRGALLFTPRFVEEVYGKAPVRAGSTGGDPAARTGAPPCE